MRANVHISKLKTVIIVLVIIILAGAGYVAYTQYQETAPRRLAVTFISDIAQHGNVKAAYALTTSSFQTTTNLTAFANAVNPLYKSGIKYTNTGVQFLNGYAFTNGVFEDLQGANFDYTFVMQKVSNNWKIKSLTVTKQ